MELPFDDLFCATNMVWVKDAGFDGDRVVILRQTAELFELFEQQKSQIETELVH